MYHIYAINVQDQGAFLLMKVNSTKQTTFKGNSSRALFFLFIFVNHTNIRCLQGNQGGSTILGRNCLQSPLFRTTLSPSAFK